MTAPMPATARDVDLLARTVYGEARGEAWPGAACRGAGDPNGRPQQRISDVCNCRLRRRLAATPFRTDTLRRQGYRLTVTSEGGG